MASDRKPEYVWDSGCGGFTCFKDGVKLCVYCLHSDSGLFHQGALIQKAVAPSQRSLHFTSPQVTVDDLRAVLDSLPAPESHPQHKLLADLVK